MYKRRGYRPRAMIASNRTRQHRHRPPPPSGCGTSSPCPAHFPPYRWIGHITDLTFFNVERSLIRINKFRLRAPGKTATNDARNGTKPHPRFAMSSLRGKLGEGEGGPRAPHVHEPSRSSGRSTVL